MGRNVLTSSVQNASFSILFQILFRCITFILNAFIIRTVGQDVLGIMNVRLLLLESTILFLSKEPILKACLTDTKSHNWRQVINQIWLSYTVPITALLGVVLVYIWVNLLSPTDQIYTIQYRNGCYAIALSCIIEQMTQSVILVAQSFCFVKLKVIFETFYIVSRTIIFVVLVVKNPNGAIDAFSIAQIVSVLILAGLYYSFFMWYIWKYQQIKKTRDYRGLFQNMDDFPFKTIWEFFPTFSSDSQQFLDRKLCILTISFAKQSIIKQVLTEGERYVMTISPVLTFSQQSVYDIVNNLGSLAARFIFRPIEESAYFYFTQMIKRDQDLQLQEQANISEATNVLNQLCKIVTSIGLIVVVFGQSYSYTLLYLYGGEKLVENELSVILLRYHSCAIVLLAINGVTEGFVFAIMTNEQLDYYNYLMVIFSISFLLISYILTNIFGPVGFIWANCLNMFARIVHSYIYIMNRYKTTKYQPLNGLIPSRRFILILIVSGIITKLSEIYLSVSSLLFHVLVGGCCFLTTIIVWGYENKSLLALGYNKYKRKLSFKQD